MKKRSLKVGDVFSCYASRDAPSNHDMLLLLYTYSFQASPKDFGVYTAISEPEAIPDGYGRQHRVQTLHGIVCFGYNEISLLI